MTKKELRNILFQLHGCSFRNEQSILKSQNCSCFLCHNTFPANSIKEWCDCNIAGHRTALCPKCGIDSIIGDADYDLGNSPIVMNLMSAQFFGGDIDDLEIEGLDDKCIPLAGSSMHHTRHGGTIDLEDAIYSDKPVRVHL